MNLAICAYFLARLLWKYLLYAVSWTVKKVSEARKVLFNVRKQILFESKRNFLTEKRIHLSVRKLHWKYKSTLDFCYQQTLQTSKQKYIHHYSFWNWIFLELLILKSESFASRHIIKSMHFLFIQLCYDLQITYSFKTGTYKCLCKISVKL